MADHKCVSGGVVWPRLMLFRRGGRANGVLRVASPVCCLLLELQHGGTELLNSYAASGLTTNVSESLRVPQSGVVLKRQSRGGRRRSRVPCAAEA